MLTLTFFALFGQGRTTLAGEPVDIASSAYQYRADRPQASNTPESWIALMHTAKLPLNKPVDLKNSAIRKALVGILWEEIRPVQTLELTWPTTSTRWPRANNLVVHTLINQGASSSWWNNLAAVQTAVRPRISRGGRTLRYDLAQYTCGIVISTSGSAVATDFDIPQVRVLVADTWKQMDVEVEWAFQPATKHKDYSGSIEAYDGRISGLKVLSGQDRASTSPAWSSRGSVTGRRGVQFSLDYMGTSTWRKEQPFTSQPDDVARSIVTLWTKSGNFSFLAADLEHGPIYAPEYGFFVRRIGQSNGGTHAPAGHKFAMSPFTEKMDSVVGDARLKGWGSAATPLIVANSTAESISSMGVTMPSQSVAVHPGESMDVVARWTSPISGQIRVSIVNTHAQAGSNGIDWTIVRDSRSGRQVLATGTTDGKQTGVGSTPIVSVVPGTQIALIVGPHGDYHCDTDIINFQISEVGGGSRVWDISHDLSANIGGSNPHTDSYGNKSWSFGSELPLFRNSAITADLPFSRASTATTARQYVAELVAQNAKTIRTQTRERPEQTWESAVTAMRGRDLPPHPAPPAGSLPPMRVSVPSQRLTDQWNLGAWHLMRHCVVDPATGKLQFNDFPYGILAAETYLVLSVLDQMGEHEAASNGFDQWLSLPMEREHPVGLFTEGRGSMTYAEGPAGYGGNMDGIHAFGPGSIGWALTQHYWMTGDRAWLLAHKDRIIASADWMLRQRKVIRDAVPGGSRLWGAGLQPALQVTPDSGGLWMQFYECEAYYWASVSRLAATLAGVDAPAAKRLQAEAESYRSDLRAAVERSIALSPVVPVRDGTYHSVVPFSCYVRGLSTGAWGWQRDGSGSHVGPLYWDTVQTAAALISPANLLPASDVRVQGYLDVLEDRLLLENPYVGNRNWFEKGWQYQGGLERTANMHLAARDIPVFLRSFFNCYAVDILPNDGYTFNEHAVHGPPDKIFEEAAFLERFRNLLVMEDGKNLDLALGTPRAWLEAGKVIDVKHAPTQFGDIGYRITSHVGSGRISAEIDMPTRVTPQSVRLHLRHPSSKRIRAAKVNGKVWSKFDLDIVTVVGQRGHVTIEVSY